MNKKSRNGKLAAFGSRVFLSGFEAFGDELVEHVERYGVRGACDAAVGEASAEAGMAELGWEELERKFQALGRAIGVRLPFLLTGELNGAEFWNMNGEPVRGDARGFGVPVGPRAEMSVGFQVRKPVAVKEGGEEIVESVQPTMEEVCLAVEVMFGWLARGETLAGCDFGSLAPGEQEVR